MKKQGCYLLLLLNAVCLGGCVSEIWTGASFVYNRHNVYKKVDDYKLAAEAHRLLFSDELLKQKGCSLDLAVFNGDILLAGHLPSSELRSEAQQRLAKLNNYREIYYQVAIADSLNNGLEDTWLTAKIRSQIIADSSIDPSVFKIITSDQIVYVMGDVKPDQAARVLNIARKTDNVVRVVKLLRYYHLSDSPKESV